MPVPSKASTASETAQPPFAAGPDAQGLGGGRLSTAALAWVQHPRLVAAGAVTGVLGVAALSYWWTKAPLYNPSGSIDPWLYTALFVNFDYIYEHFGDTYYASRLPWIVPGRILYGVLPVDAAYWTLHGIAFVAGVVCVFALVRRYLGVAAAVVGGGTLALSPMYWNAQYWDYVDGIALTYLAAGLCFGLPLSTGSRRAASLFAAGIFLAAAVTTNLFVALVVLVYPIAYLFLQPATGLRQRLSLAVRDVLALGLGAANLVAALGTYASLNGGEFFYFQIQIDLAGTDVSDPYKAPNYEWLHSEPRVLVPIFLVAVAVPFLILGRRRPQFRFAAASVCGLAFLTLSIYYWEFAAGGAALEYTYYFSYFTVSIALAMASVTALAVSIVRSRSWASVGTTLAATLAAVGALGVIYHEDRLEWTARPGERISVVAMVVAAPFVLGVLLTRRRLIGPAAAAAAIGAVAFASHFALNSSAGTFVYSGSAPANGDLYQAAIDHVDFVSRSTGTLLPTFWFDEARRPDIRSIQSMYYYGYTYLDVELPRVTRQLRERLAIFRPQLIVMLCDTRNCGGGAAALGRAGYSYQEKSATLISRGGVRIWAVLLQAA